MKRNSTALLAALAMVAAVASPFAVARAQEPKVATPVLCAVKGEEIKDVSKAAGKTEYNGKTYYLCCAGCVAKFNKSDDAAKAKFAKLTDLRTQKIVLTRQLDAVTSELSATEKAGAAKADKKAATGTAASNVVYCAVTGEEIGNAELASGKAEYKGKTYYFCCAGCQPKFEKDPAKYSAQADKKSAAPASH